MDKKTCSKCGEEKLYVDFKPNKGYADGYHTWCRACLRIHANEWKRSNAEQLKEYIPKARENNRQHKARNRERLRLEGLAYYHDNIEDRSAYSKRYTAEHPEIKRAAHVRRKEEYLAIVVAHYGGGCYCCGESNPLFLTLDHINDDGAKERKTRKGGSQFYATVIREGFPTNLRLACWNCNCARYYRGGICPHQTERLRLVAAS